MVTEATRSALRTVPARDGGARSAQLERRAWRARERAARSLTPAGKVVHRGGRVDAAPKAKPKGKAR